MSMSVEWIRSQLKSEKATQKKVGSYEVKIKIEFDNNITENRFTSYSAWNHHRTIPYCNMAAWLHGYMEYNICMHHSHKWAMAKEHVCSCKYRSELSIHYWSAYVSSQAAPYPS